MRASKLKINNEYTHEYGINPKGRIEVPSPEEDIQQIYIKGRNGSLTRKYGFKDIILPIHFTMYDMTEGFKPKFRKIKSKLYEAKTLIFDDDISVFYKVKSIQIETAENIIKQFGEFTVNFTLDPFQYELSNEPITITSPTTIPNDGYTALPTITATVAGTGKIYIGEQEVTVKDVNGDITIDSTMQNAYRQGSPPINMNKNMVGKFPFLEHGIDQVSFDGDISKLVVVANRRWR